MIGNPILGKGFRGALNYIAEKDQAEFFASNMAGRTPRELAKEFGLVRHLKPRLGKAVCHMFFRPAEGETLTPAQWREVLDRAIVGMGFERSPYVAYMHRDAGTDHLHILTSRIAYDGSVVSDSHNWPRMMRISAQIERDFGLRIVPRDGPAASPKPEESGRARRTGETSARSRVVEGVDRAARGGGSISDFVGRLRAEGIEVFPSIGSTGRVSGISFVAEGFQWKGSDLGRAYSWPGLQRHFRLSYQPDLDQPALLEARVAAQDRGLPSADVAASPKGSKVVGNAASGPDRPAGGPSSASGDLARDQVSRHLDALGASRFTLAVVDTGRASRDIRTAWTKEQVVEALGWLRQRNATGADILVRPQACPTRAVFVLSDVSSATLDRAEESGCEPAAVVQLGPDRHELWLRHPPAAPEVAAGTAAQVAARLALDREKSPSDYGHLAGFRVQSLDRRGRETAPYATLTAASGREFELGPALLSGSARDAVVARTRELAVGARSVDLPEPLLETAILYRDNPRGVPLLEPNPTALAAALDGLAAHQLALERAEEHLLAAAPETLPLREAAYERAFSELRDSRLAVCGHSAGCSPDLESAILARHSELVFRLENARADAFGSHPLAELRVAYLEGELSAFRRGQRLSFPESPLPAAHRESLDSAYRAASTRLEELRRSVPVDPAAWTAALSERLAASQGLARCDEQLARSYSHLGACREELVHRLASFEERGGLGPAGTDEAPLVDRQIYSHTVAELGKTDLALRQLEAPALEARTAALGRSLDHLRPAILTAPDRPLVERYLDVLERRLEIRAHLADSPGGPRPEDLPTLRAAVEAAAERVEGASRQVLLRPSSTSTDALEAAAGRRFTAHQDLSRAVVGEDLRSARSMVEEARAQLRELPGQTSSIAYADAVSHLEAASIRRELLSPPPVHSGSPGLPALLERLGAGDRSPALFQDLHRQLIAEIAARGRTVSPAAEPSLRGGADLEAAVRFHMEATDRLSGLFGAPSGHLGTLSVPRLEELRGIVLRYQQATRTLHEAAEGPTAALPFDWTARSATREVAEMAALERAGAVPTRSPDRWQATFPRPGYPASRAAAGAGDLHQRVASRAWRHLTGSPRAYTSFFLATATLAGLHYAQRLVRSFVHDQVHSR